MFLHSSTDKTIRYCHPGESDTEFWQRWKDELAGIGREMAEAKPDGIGMFLVNCKFHGALGSAYDKMPVSVLDSDSPDDVILLRDSLYNFVKGIHPFQAIDDMTVINPGCRN